MSNFLIRSVIRTRFLLTRRESASASIEKIKNQYLQLAGCVDTSSGKIGTRVPPMMGVDPEMREWSFFQILEHNAIVNKIISRTVEKLALGQDPAPDRPINPKTDVLPHHDCGADSAQEFYKSIDDHLMLIASLPDLRGTAETEHPVFGSFDAHKWHCMFGFHLNLHLKQARKVLALLNSGRMALASGYKSNSINWLFSGGI